MRPAPRSSIQVLMKHSILKAVALALCTLVSLSPVACGKSSSNQSQALPNGMLSEGANAPDLSAVDQNGVSHRLSDERGHYTLVYFYPKDATPGCTKEACAFRDVWDRFTKANVQIFGISADDQQSKQAFAKEHKLTFPLLADPNSQWIRAFGVPTRLGMAKRVSFLIDPNGKIAKVYADVDPGVHATQVLDDVAKR